MCNECGAYKGVRNKCKYMVGILHIPPPPKKFGKREREYFKVLMKVRLHFSCDRNSVKNNIKS